MEGNEYFYGLSVLQALDEAQRLPYATDELLPPDQTHGLMSISAAARWLQVDRSTLHRWIAAGWIEARPMGNRRYISGPELKRVAGWQS